VGQKELPSGVKLYAKLELWNPGGSVKDRIGVSMIRAAEAAGILRPGSTIVAATAANTGIGIALAALGRGYQVVFTVPAKFSAEKQAVLRALGAIIVNTPTAEGMAGATRAAAELRDATAGAVTLDQFTDLANPDAHYRSTGPEIYRDMDGQVDLFVAGAGSGGTFTGVARHLKEKLPQLRTVLVDPHGSTMGGGPCHPYAIEGIGNDFVPEVMDLGLVDQVVKVSDADARAGARRLASVEGVLGGLSSGAAYHAALEVGRGLERGNLVTVFPDRGDRYVSKGIYDAPEAS
jgi:cysteine synthase A